VASYYTTKRQTSDSFQNDGSEAYPTDGISMRRPRRKRTRNGVPNDNVGLDSEKHRSRDQFHGLPSGRRPVRPVGRKHDQRTRKDGQDSAGPHKRGVRGRSPPPPDTDSGEKDVMKISQLIMPAMSLLFGSALGYVIVTSNLRRQDALTTDS